MKKISLTLIFILLFTNFAFANIEVKQTGELLIDEKNYSKLTDGNYTFGTNVWHTRYLETSAQFPFTEIWKKNLSAGQTFGQPVIVGDRVVAQGGNCIYVMDLKTGQILNNGGKGIQIQWDTSKNGIYSSPLYISNEDGWFNEDKLPRIFIGTRDGILYSLRLQGSELYEDWHYDTGSKLADKRYSGIGSSPVLLFDRNSNFKINGKKTVYIGVGDYNGQVHIVDARMGQSIPNGYHKFQGQVSSSPISYSYMENKTYSNLALGIHGGHSKDDGFVFGGYVRNGMFVKDKKLNKDYFNQIADLKGIPSSVSIAEHLNPATNELEYIFIFSDRKGTLYGYNEHTKKLAFEIHKYDGADSRNTPSIIGNKYAVFTLSNYKGKAKVVCVDIDSAINEGLYNLQTQGKPYADAAVMWETNNKDFGGVSYVGATGLNIIETKEDFDNAKTITEKAKVLIVADQGTKAGVPNLKMYYVDKTNGNNPQKVQSGFSYKDSLGTHNTWGLYLQGGVKGEPSFANGVLLVADGAGNLHAFSYAKKNNISVLNVRNNKNPIEKGGRYTASVDIVNHSGKDLYNVKCDFTIDKSIYHTVTLDKLPADGITLNLDYTLPENFDKENLSIEVNVNKEHTATDEKGQVIQETTYEDNKGYIEIPLVKDLDLEIWKIEYNTYYPGAYGPVNVYVKNNSKKALDNIPVKVIIANSITDVENISLGPESSAIVPFRLKAPNKATTFTIKGEINHSKVYQEADYNNNKKTINARVIKYDVNCSPTTSTWVEYRSTGSYKSGDIIKRYYNKKGKVIGYDVKFYAKLKGDFKVYDAKDGDQKIKSGYGIKVKGSTWIQSNYDRKYKLTNAQRAYAYFPGSGTPTNLKHTTWNLSKAEWELPINQNSVTEDNIHFIPVRYEDGKYKVVVKAAEASTPGGRLNICFNLYMDVKGDMYEDDTTGKGTHH